MTEETAGTPRTDALVKPFTRGIRLTRPTENAVLDLARQLEREVTALTTERDELQKRIGYTAVPQDSQCESPPAEYWEAQARKFNLDCQEAQSRVYRIIAYIDGFYVSGNSVPWKAVSGRISHQWTDSEGRRCTQFVAEALGSTVSEADANARLIAAAPELQEVLRDAQDELELDMRSNNPTLRARIRAVLAKLDTGTEPISEAAAE